MAAIAENFYRRSELISFEYQLETPCKVLADNDSRLWASIQVDQSGVPMGVTTNPFAQLGDSDVCMFFPAQGACYFETYGSNELYILGLPVGTSIAISSCFKEPKLVQSRGRDVRKATRIKTTCGGGVLGAAVGGSFPFLPADVTRRRAHVKGDSVFGALTTAAEALSSDFMPLAPFFPGYVVVEGTEELRFLNFGTGPTSAWWIVDSEVPA